MKLTLAEKFWKLEHDPNWQTVLLPVGPEDDGVEEVLVERVGDSCYRIAASPGFIEGLAADDVIQFDESAPAGYLLLRHGRNLCIHIYCEARERNVVQAELIPQIEAVGGWLDGTMGSSGLCLTVPLDAGFSKVESLLNAAVGNEWYFSNVYNMETGELLNWWL